LLSDSCTKDECWSEVSYIHVTQGMGNGDLQLQEFEAQNGTTKSTRQEYIRSTSNPDLYRAVKGALKVMRPACLHRSRNSIFPQSTQHVRYLMFRPIGKLLIRKQRQRETRQETSFPSATDEFWPPAQSSRTACIISLVIPMYRHQPAFIQQNLRRKKGSIHIPIDQYISLIN